MAPVTRELEITLAQRLASNDKPIRTKALKTLRKYINLRSQKVEGGFTSEDLLKIWKGLFYCLWMQDKPLLQEEISLRISGLIQSFHTTEYQLLYFSTFLQTVKREWNGIDRLRMDKFFQLVRFMFRRAFEALRRREWDSSVVNQFLQIFTEQILQSPDQVPKGLMLHVLDLYMTELALEGSAELTADQNLTFIEPFCKTLAKTKDRMLLACVSKNIFMTIVEHAPYAIEDLIKELQQQREAEEDSDSGQASGEEEDVEEEVGEEKELKKEIKGKKNNGIREEVENSMDELDDDSMGSEEDDSVGPVLQFDYGAIADHLFELGSHLNTRNINRTKMYRLVKIFRDLGEGVFFQNVVDKRGVSDSSGGKMLKKKKGRNKQSKTGKKKLAKKSKACQDEQKPSDSVQDDDPLNDDTQNLEPEKRDQENVKPDGEKAVDTSHVLLEAGESDTRSHRVAGITLKKKRKSKKQKTNSQYVEEEVTDKLQCVLEETAGEYQAERRQKPFKATSVAGSIPTSADQKDKMASHAEIPVESGQAECSISLVKEKTKKKRVKKQISLHGHSEVTETEADQAETPGGDHELESSIIVRKKKRKSQKLCSGLQEGKQGGEIRKLTTSPSPDEDKEAAQTPVGTSATQKKKKREKSCLQEVEEAVKSPVVLKDAVKHNDDEISRHPCPASKEDGVTLCATTKKKRKSKKFMSSSQEVNSPSSAEVMATDVATSAFGVTRAEAQPSDAFTPRTKKSKKKKAKEDTGSKLEFDLDVKEAEVSSDSVHFTTSENKEAAAECSQPKPEKKAKKKKLVSSNEEEPVLEAGKQPAAHTHTACKKKKTQKKQEGQLAEEAREDAILKKPGSKKAGTEVHDAVLSDDLCTPEVQSLNTSVKRGKKKRKLQADGREPSQINGHAEEQQGIEISISATPKKLKMDKATTKSHFVSFQAEIKTPTPLFCKTRRRVSTPLSSVKQKFQTPKSESKKVTFGLKNNKTAEFRKTDSSVLVSPVGSSRVAFDPKKKPVSGVLKSPSLSPVVSVKKPAAKKRATAADFF